MLNKRVGVVVVILLVGAFTVAITQGPGGPPTGENILVIVIDDIGVESVGAYAEGRCLATDDVCSADGDCGPGGDCRPDWVPMDRLDTLVQEGTVFRSAWSQPSCSPTRATILTGR
jgi:arylsulfatase A-like enzyme